LLCAVSGTIKPIPPVTHGQIFFQLLNSQYYEKPTYGQIDPLRQLCRPDPPTLPCHFLFLFRLLFRPICSRVAALVIGAPRPRPRLRFSRPAVTCRPASADSHRAEWPSRVMCWRPGAGGAPLSVPLTLSPNKLFTFPGHFRLRSFLPFASSIFSTQRA
jgi:hypothetical protein